MDDSLDAPEALDRDKALTLSALAARAWCVRMTPDAQDAGELVRRLMEASSWVSRARRHHALNALRIADLVEAFDKPVGEWLPGAGVFALVEDGQPAPLCHDLADDAGASALAEVEQRVIKSAMDNLLGKKDEAEAYTAFRRFLVEHAHARHAEAARAVQSVGLDLSQVFTRISADCVVSRSGTPVFYPCPRCRWPMSIRGEAVSCSRSPTCLTAGARFTLRNQGLLALGALVAPESEPATGMAAILPGVWRYTVLPGLEELDLARRLEKISGVAVQLWPYVDAYDLDVQLGDHRWRVDVKDHVSAMRLARHLSEKPAREPTWIVVPDLRKEQVPVLQRHVGPDAGYSFAHSSEFVRRVRGVA